MLQVFMIRFSGGVELTSINVPVLMSLLILQITGAHATKGGEGSLSIVMVYCGGCGNSGMKEFFRAFSSIKEKGSIALSL